MKEYGDKIPADKKDSYRSSCNKLKEAHKAQDLAAIELASTEMNNAWTAASEDIYNAQQQGAVHNPQEPVANRVLMQEQGNNKVEMVMQRMYRMYRLRR